MDVKGISWVGNIYQKFEAMCLEVEEIMYQDTVKYVENQVQTVGSSVKKFYADVMQDLLPPSSADAAKGAGTEVPLELYSDLGIYTKPKVGEKEKPGKVADRERFTEDPKNITNKKSDDPLSFHRLNQTVQSLSQGVGGSRQHGKRFLSNKSNPGTKNNFNRENMSLGNKSRATNQLDKYLARASSLYEPLDGDHLGDSTGGTPQRYGDGDLSNESSPVTVENSKRRNMFPNEKSMVITPLYEDFTNASPVCELSNENHKECADQEAKNTTPGHVEVTGHDYMDKGKYYIEDANEQIPDMPMEGTLCDVVNSIEFGMNRETDIAPSSYGSSSADTLVADDHTSDGMEFPIVANARVQSSEIAEEDFVCNSVRSDDCTTDMNMVDFSINPDKEIIQQVDKTKLEESCIFVNGDECHLVSPNEGKSKSYKKKIRDVFSPKKKSVRKQEYEKLSEWHGSYSNSNQEECAKNLLPSLTIKDSKKSSIPDSCESEWELL